MRLLLDTHIFLWFISGSSQLPIGFRDNISNPDNEVYLSVVSVWGSIINLPASTSTVSSAILSAEARDHSGVDLHCLL